ncbi:caspase family protein [Sabulilitoribacter multivorans]|uniref:Caspase family protein n=1 Tax=Flaviramulus multivorans TaxID=1304750 RepID=A0ABS9IMQ8_9FLAO|nr:caspase family protein [Flaviramulus multivorans]MCF7561880.1 caspase family protein [Flaviramulus multivorans]
MKRLISICLILFICNVIHAEKHALIVAVGDYPKSTGWASISSVNDVPLIKQTLLNQEFKEENISLLINEAATYKGIKNALQNLLNRIKPNDIVVIHFSMHGQQIFDDNGEEIDGKDEALVPYDAWVRYNHNYKGENHFRDDELGAYIAMFRNALQENGQLVLLLDSCHSGSTSRGGIARGSQAVFAPSGWSAKSNEVDSGSGLIETKKAKLNDNAAPYILISGASANELNYEYKGYGSLSYAFSKAMDKLGSNYSFNQLFAKIEAEMNIISPRQSPTIEGDLNVKLFNNAYVKQQPFFKIKSILRSDVIRVQAGKLHGLFKNTTIAILPSATTKVEDKNIITKGTIVNSKYNESTIQLEKPLDNLNEKAYWVFVDKPTYGEMSIDVFFDKSLSDDSIKNGVKSFLKETQLGSVVTDSAVSDVILTQLNNKIVINSTNGLHNVDADEETRGGTDSLDLLNQTLFNFAQGQYLKNLDFKNYNYEFEFSLLPIEIDPITDSIIELEVNDFINENGTFQMRPEKDIAILQITNKSNKPIYFSIIEINSKGEIFPFLPNDECSLNNDERRLLPGQTMQFKDCHFRFHPPFEKLILKGFATPYPIDFQETVETRGESSSNMSNPLESLLRSTYKPNRGGSGSNNINTKIDGFSTEFVYEIVKD